MPADTKTLSDLSKNNSSEMIIECDGTFRIDIANYRMSIEDNVQVAFRDRGLMDDTMVCDKLHVTF